MSVIYYCDAPSCGNKEPGRDSEAGWVPPDGWTSFGVEGKTFDACNAQHEAQIIEAHTPEPEPEEEEEASEG